MEEFPRGSLQASWAYKYGKFWQNEQHKKFEAYKRLHADSAFVQQPQYKKKVILQPPKKY